MAQTSSAIQQYLNQVQEKKLARPHQCPSCKAEGSLRWHGTYQRILITFHREWIIPIRRLLCPACRHTFALLPPFIMKWHRYAKEVIKTAVKWLRSKTFNEVADVFYQRYQREVATLTLYLWRKRLA